MFNSILKSLNETRWSCWIESSRSILINFDSIISTIEQINETNYIHGSDASSLIKNIQDFEFIFYMEFMKQVFQLTNSSSIHFQKKKKC